MGRKCRSQISHRVC